MRNSLFPFVLLAVTVAAALWLIRPQHGEERGKGGPAVFPGIAQVPTKEKYLTPSAKLVGGTTHTGQVPAGSADWRVVLVVGGDDHALTRTLLEALGEELTRRGRIAILDPKQHNPDEPLPVGSDGSLRVTVADPPAIGDAPGAIAVTWRVAAIPTRLPAGHPAARWLPALPETAPTALDLSHHSTPDGAASWPGWYAGIGRSAADELLDAMGIPAPVGATALAAADAETARSIRLTAWTMPGVNDAQGKPATPFGRIPAPPQRDLLEQAVAFQQPFVRGWIGRLSPVPVNQRTGGTLSARDELVRRLLRGGWTRDPGAGDDLLFTIDDHGEGHPDVHRAISVSGDLLVEWQERPQPIALWQAWAAVAKVGDSDAQAQIARHRGTAGLPAELRAVP